MATKHKVRTKAGGLKDVNLTRSTAIKAFCTECLGWQTHPRECTAYNCSLYPFRGKTNLTVR